MQTSRRIRLFPLLCSVFVCFGVSLAQAPKTAAKTPPPTITSGPKVGQKIPDFEVLDQHGRKQTLQSLSGPNGLLLLFHRSADW